MKLIAWILLLGISATSFAQNADSTWIRNNYYKIERMIPMRDGVKLFTAFYIPKDSSERHPILFNRTPYSCAPYGEGNFKAFSNKTSSSRIFEDEFYKNYYKEKYIMVYQDVRGKYMSEGEFVDVRPFITDKKTTKDIDEASDTYDAIDWMVKNVPLNNGNVGVFGISYPGFYATMAALSNHPALKAVSPQAPVTDWFIGDDFHHNGALMLMDAFDFYSSFGRPRLKPTTTSAANFNYPTQDNYSFYLRTGALLNFTKKYMGDSIQFWNDLMNHPTNDAWWKARNPRNFVTNVKPAILIVGGAFDAEDCFGAWNLYKAIEKESPSTNNRLVVGPWFHGGWVRSTGSNLGNVQFENKTSEWYQQKMELPFFNFYLKNKGTDKNIAEANIYFTGENAWHQLPEWPPANVQQKEIYLQKGGMLSWDRPAEMGSHQKPGDDESFTEYVSDPAKPVPYTGDVHLERTREYMTDDQRFASRRPDVLTFQTNILTEDMTLAGPVIADLMVSTTGSDADFVVKVVDVFPDDFKYATTDPYVMTGYQMLVRGEVMRGKFRNSFEKPEPFVPKKMTGVKFALPDVAHTFKKGHRLMIQIQSSWFPLVDRNPQKFVDIYHAKDEDFQKASIRIYHSGSVGSKIILPVVKW